MQSRSTELSAEHPSSDRKPNSILTAWYSGGSSSQMHEAGISDFKARLSWKKLSRKWFT